MSDCRLSSEHGMKVAAGCSKHSSVTEELLIIDCHADICQLTTVVHWLHHLQNSRCESGVSVCRVCCSTAHRALARPCWLAPSPTTRSARSSVSQALSSCRSLLAKDRAWSASCSSWLGLFSVLFTTRTTHTHVRLTALCPGLPGWAGTRKVKTIWILLKHETVSGSGISWAICKSAPCSRQITMPAPHHSVFYRPNALPVTQPTASKHWRLLTCLLFTCMSYYSYH